MSTKIEKPRPQVPSLDPWLPRDRQVCLDFLEHCASAAQSALYSLKRVPKNQRPKFLDGSIKYWSDILKGFRWAQGQAMRRRVAEGFPDVRDGLSIEISPNQAVEISSIAIEYDPNTEME